MSKSGHPFHRADQLYAAEKAVVEAAIVYLNTGPKAPYGGSYEAALATLKDTVAKVLELRDGDDLPCECGHPRHKGQQCSWFWERPGNRPTQCMCGLDTVMVHLPGSNTVMLSAEDYQKFIVISSGSADTENELPAQPDEITPWEPTIGGEVRINCPGSVYHKMVGVYVRHWPVWESPYQINFKGGDFVRNFELKELERP